MYDTPTLANGRPPLKHLTKMITLLNVSAMGQRIIRDIEIRPRFLAGNFASNLKKPPLIYPILYVKIQNTVKLKKTDISMTLVACMCTFGGLSAFIGLGQHTGPGLFGIQSHILAHALTLPITSSPRNRLI